MEKIIPRFAEPDFIRFTISNAEMNDTVYKLKGVRKQWNGYPADEVERMAKADNLIPQNFYYSEYDTTAERLIFVSQEKEPKGFRRKLQSWRHNFDRWCISKGF
jgi:hypothetical protein